MMVETNDDQRATSLTRLPSYPWRFAHLAALWAYGVSQPVFSMLKGNPEFLVVRGSSRLDVVVFALVLAFVPPLAVIAIEALAGVVSRALSALLHIGAVFGFAYLAALQLTRLLDIEGGAALLLPVVPAVLAMVLYGEVHAFRSFLSLSFLLPVVAVLGFVATVPLVVDDAPAANVRVANPVPVVLVTFDEFPVSSLMRADGSLDAARYPNFARLAREGTWYPHATSANETTTQAVPAILTGVQPRHPGLPTLADHPDNLFTLLGRRYTLRASEQVTRLCPTRYCPQTAPQAPLLDRQRGLFYDVAVGYMHRVLPHALAGELPPIGERWGDSAIPRIRISRIGSSARSTRTHGFRSKRRPVDRRRVSSPAFFGRSGRRGRSGLPSISSMRFSRTLPGVSCPPVGSIRTSISPRASQATQIVGSRSPLLSTRLSSGISFRSATRIACWGCCYAASRRRACTTARS